MLDNDEGVIYPYLPPQVHRPRPDTMESIMPEALAKGGSANHHLAPRDAVLRDPTLGRQLPQGLDGPVRGLEVVVPDSTCASRGLRSA